MRAGFASRLLRNLSPREGHFAPEALVRLNDFHVLTYRLFGVHVKFSFPAVIRPDPWDWPRPPICDAIRRTPGLVAHCDASEDAIARRSGRRSTTEVCHAGLGQFAIPFGRGQRVLGHVICCPIRLHRDPDRSVRSVKMRIGDLPGLREARKLVSEVPFLGGEGRSALEFFTRGFFASFLRQVADGKYSVATWNFPCLRAPDQDDDTWLSFLWAGIEASSTEPTEDGWHCHRSQDVLLYTVRGPCLIEMPGGCLNVPRGRLLLLPAGQRYKVASSSGHDAVFPFWFHYVSNVNLSRIALQPFVPSAAIHRLLRVFVWRTEDNVSFFWKTEARLQALELLLEIRTFVEKGPPHSGRGREPTVSAAVERARRYLEAAADRRVALAEVARASGVHGATLCTQFRRSYGVPPMAFHRARRLREALRLLRDGGLPPREVSARLGFSNLQHFSAAFKRQFGRPPRLAARNV